MECVGLLLAVNGNDLNWERVAFQHAPGFTASVGPGGGVDWRGNNHEVVFAFESYVSSAKASEL